MGFHDDLFPVEISLGSASGVAFKTFVSKTDSGDRHPLGKWENPLCVFDVAYGARKLTDLHAIRAFYRVRGGAMNSFPFQDPLDCQSNPNDPSIRSAAGTADQPCDPPSANGSTTVFSLVKSYASGAYSSLRRIITPVVSTIRVWVGGVEQVGNWSVSRTTGKITFSSAPSSGLVRWSGSFHNRCFFEEDAEEGISASIDGWNVGSISPIRLVEDISAYEEEPSLFFYGGADDRVIGAPISITTGAFLYRLSASASGLSCTLPDPTNLIPGGDYFRIANTGANSFVVKDHSGSTLATLATNKCVSILLTQNGSGVKAWLAEGA